MSRSKGSSAKGVPFKRFRDEVLEIYSLDRKPKTVEVVRQVLDELLATGLKSTTDLTPAAVARWRKAHSERSPGTTHKLMRSLRSACEIGIASGYLRSSPLAVKQVWPEVVPSAEPRHHAIADIRAVLLRLQERSVLSWHDHRLYALAATVAYTGVRRNEALYLTTPDVDFRRCCIRIVARRKLKTRASEAPVGMPDELAAILIDWAPKTGALWLFPGATRSGPWTGGPPGQKPLDRLKAEASAIGVHGFTFQSLRHSWATHGEFWGLGETMIQRQLRHTTRKTQQHYRHIDVANIAASVRGLSYLAPPASSPAPAPPPAAQA